MKTFTSTLQAVSGYPHAYSNQMPHPYLSKNKQQIEQELLSFNYHLIYFSHWLYVVELDLVLSFEKQICIQVGNYSNV